MESSSTAPGEPPGRAYRLATALRAIDQIVSTAGLIDGVAAAAARNDVLISAVVAADDISIAAGEHVSVSFQSNVKRVDSACERTTGE